MWGQIAAAAVGAWSENKQRKAQQSAADEARRQADLAYKRSLPWDVTGAFGEAQFDEEGRKLDLSLSAPWQKEYDVALGGAEKQRQYIAGMEADPMAAGQKFYDMQKALYAPEQESQRLALENRLLGQGMLGSTGGAGQTQALLEAQRQQDLQAQYAGLDKAQSMIDTYRGRAASDLSVAEGIGQLPQKYATTGQGIGADLSDIAGKAGQMGSDAAQGVGASNAAYYSNLGNQFKELQDNWKNPFASQTSHPPFKPPAGGMLAGPMSYLKPLNRGRR